MAKIVKIVTPLTDEVVSNLKAGDMVSITGYIYTGRDAAHKRLFSLLQKGEKLPLEIRNQLKKLKGRFGVKRVIFVEDRGMIKSEQMKDIGEFKWNFITAITKAQIKLC